MGLFDIFKKKVPLTEEQIKWNYLWELWSREEIGAPYDALMTVKSITAVMLNSSITYQTAEILKQQSAISVRFCRMT